MATRQVLAELTPLFAQASGIAVQIEAMGGVDAAKRVQAGEAFDVVMLASDAIDKLIASGHLHSGSRVDLMRSGVAAAVQAGAVMPDLSSEDAVRRAVLAAGSISYSTGPSGVALAALFARWGIADLVKDRMVQAPPGVPVGSLVASGQVDLGFQQLSELLHVPGIQVLGLLPQAIAINTVFSAGIPRALEPTCAAYAQVVALLNFLNSPTATAAKLRQGMATV
jgi:molybdate transport system substrate-binding protein